MDLAELRRCAGLATDSLKLACFETLAAMPAEGSSPDHLSAGEAADVLQAEDRQPGMQVEPAAADAAPLTAAAPVEAPSQPAAPETPAAPSPPADSVAPVAEQSAVAAAPVAIPETEADDPLDSWGVDRSGEPEVAYATVVEVTKARYGELIFQFDNGQVWRQQEKRYFPYPRDREFDVTLSTGMMGEVRLQVEGAGRRTTIKRLK